MRFTTQLLPKRSSNLAILVLNNPKALHALTLEMMHCTSDVLKEWYKDDSLQAILLKSSETSNVRSFCAGGDVKAVYKHGLETTTDEQGNPVVHGQGVHGVGTAEFFRQEYYVNHMLCTSKIPQISLWNGIVMGGGVGVSIYGKYRVATEHTVFAMPETGIGLFPDVGSLYWMPRMLNMSMAKYLALTGARLKAADLMETGLATHYIPSEKLDDLEAALVSATESDSDTTLDSVLGSFHQSPPEASTFPGNEIERTFDAETIEQILENLLTMDTNFAQTTIQTLGKMSPTSLKVTLEGLKRGAACKTITEDLHMEFRIGQAFMRNHDFYEGIRAALVDKDNTPLWKPATLAQVTDINDYFAPIEHEWEIPKELREHERTTAKR